jgi:integrase/recombinase XerD
MSLTAIIAYTVREAQSPFNTQEGRFCMSVNALHPFEQFLRAQDLSASSLRGYLGDMAKFVQWYEGWTGEPFDPTAMTTPAITRYRAHLQEQRLKPASINRYLVSIKKFCAWCVENDLLQRDPARSIKLVPETKPAPRKLTDREEHALMVAVEKYGTARDRAILIILLHTGVRAMELCNLQRADVTILGRAGSLAVRGGKRNKFRTVPLNPTARKALAQYLETENPSLWVFPSEKTGDRLSERALRFLVAKYAHLAKVPDVSPHDLRHRFGYRMAEKTPLHRLAQLMGHDSLDTTLIYVSATEKDLQAEVDKIAWE